MHVRRNWLWAASLTAGSALVIFTCLSNANAQEARNRSCSEMASELVDFVNNDASRFIVFQISSNKSRDRSGHFSLGEGLLYEETGNSIWTSAAPIAMYVMQGFKDHEDIFGGEFGSDRGSQFGTARRDEVILRLYRNGQVELTLVTWGNTRLNLEDSRCYSNRFGYYMNGIMEEVNGTRTIGLVMRKYRP